MIKQDLAGAMLYGVLASFLLSLLVVVTKRWHGGITLDGTDGVQKMHSTPTPRVGGLPIVLALAQALYLAPPAVHVVLFQVLIAGLPAFLFGIAEDLTKRVGVLPRLLATMLSGVLACWLSGNSLQRVDVWGVDALLQWMPLSWAFTAFAVGGVANAINIIDGLNGLASSMLFFTFLGLVAVCYSVGDPVLAGACIILACVVLGFFCVNWPFGKLFLGDGGSYFLGFALAWMAVLLTQRHDDVSAFTALLLCVHPVTEVVFSIYRRKIRHMHPGMPDRVHFHSLVKRRLMSRWFPHLPKSTRNSLAGVGVGAMSIPPALVAQYTYDSTALSLVAVMAFMLGYVTLYARVIRFHWCSPLAFLFAKPVIIV